ncbi:MAG: HupE/UreJ family protein [Gammaproteobacteria bacterium]
MKTPGRRSSSHRLPARWGLFALCVASLVSQAALAHANGTSYLTIRLDGQDSRLVAAWDIPVSDLQLPLELDADGDGELTSRELDARRAAILRFATRRLELRQAGGPCALTAGELTTRQAEPESFIRLALTGSCPGSGPLQISTSLFFGSPGHTTLLDVSTPQGRFPAALSMGRASWTEPESDSWVGTLLRFLREGIWHVLIGYDHVAFLLLLLLPSVLRRSGSGRSLALGGREVAADLVRIVTAFTLAHSTTLGLASTGTVALPVQPVEAAIAGSIVVAGLLNLFPAASRWRLPLAFGFGLIHGFGFANALREIGEGEIRLAPMLAGFNLGVEFAQLLIIAVALPILWLASRRPRYSRQFMPALSLATALTGAVWFAGRL